MKSLLVAVACSMLAFSGCERHPVAQLREINERSEINPEKKSTNAEREPDSAQPGSTARVNPSPRSYFPADAK